MVPQRRDDGALAPDRRVSRRQVGRVMAAAAVAAAWGRTSASAAPALQSNAAPIRIGSNENPYGLGPASLAAIGDALAEANRYPFDVVWRLGAALSSMHEVGRDRVLVTPGSGEILRAATMAFTSPSLALVGASPTFEAPARTAEMIGAPVRAVPVLANGSLDLAGMAERARGAGLFFVCNPNNPTGGVSSAEAVKELVARVRRAAPDAVLLIDEAYHDYVTDPGYATAVPMTRTDRRIVVSRTFSKIYGMAGLRVGYAVGHPDALDALRRVGSQGALSNVSTAAALAALGDREHHGRQRALNSETKAFTRKAFEEAGFQVLPSEANFIMVDVRRPVGSFAAACRGVGVSIARPFPPLMTHARVSIGTQDEMTRAMALILPILAAPASAHAEPFSMGGADAGFAGC